MSSRLDGISVLVTRPRPFNEDTCDLVRAEGGRAISLPAIRIEPQAIETITGACGWAIFGSRNAVRHGHRSLDRGGHPPRVAAIGSATAEELERLGFTDIVCPEHGFTTERLSKEPKENHGLDADYVFGPYDEVCCDLFKKWVNGSDSRKYTPREPISTAFKSIRSPNQTTQ